MSGVKYPNARRHVIGAVAELADAEYQQRVWIDHQYPTPTYYSDLRMVIHTLYDDWMVLPDPDAAVGSILVAGDEVERLRNLGVVLDLVIDELYGEPDAIRLADPRWPEVVRRAGLALAAMVRAGLGWPTADETG